MQKMIFCCWKNAKIPQVPSSEFFFSPFPREEPLPPPSSSFGTSWRPARGRGTSWWGTSRTGRRHTLSCSRKRKSLRGGSGRRPTRWRGSGGRWWDGFSPFLPDCKQLFPEFFTFFSAIFTLLRPKHYFYANCTSCSTSRNIKTTLWKIK